MCFHVFWTFDHLFEYLQVLEVIPAGKGKKNFEIYQRKQYLKAQLDCYKTAKFGSLYSRGNLLATSIFVF